MKWWNWLTYNLPWWCCWRCHWDILTHALDDSRADKDFGNYFSRCWCRYKGHAGPVWYGKYFEPDMRCEGCGEDLG